MTTRRSKNPKPKGGKTTRAAASRGSAADLQKQLDRRTGELANTQKLLTEALRQQTATADVLKVISRSAFDLQTVLQTLVESAARLCGADKAQILRPSDGNHFYAAASYGHTPEYNEYLSTLTFAPGREGVVGRVLLEGEPVQIADVLADPDYRLLETQRLGGFRTHLGVPLLREGNPVGILIVSRVTVRPFDDKQIELLTTFADQAVIAIENARLFEEVQAKTRDLEESLQQQTATSEVLQVISSSPGDVAPVFDKMLENATRVCGAEFGSMYLVEDDSLRQAALYNVPAALAAARTNKVFRPHPQGQMAAAIRTKQVVQVADVRTTAAYLERTPNAIELAELGGARTLVVVPMLREDEVIGAITIYRQEVRPFADKQIELVSNFAKQAVIAIENARLLRELRQSLQQQTATSEVLQVISSSPGDLAPVFAKMLENATRICGANFGQMNLYEEGHFRPIALYNTPAAYTSWLARTPFEPHPQSALGAVARTHQVMHIEDIRTLPPYREGNPSVVALADLAGARTYFVVPMLKENELIGAITIYRQEVRPFTDNQIDLVTTFARQAVIAIENARLLGELRERTTDLGRSVDELTATADVLKIISRSSVDLETVLDTLVETVARLCRADQAYMVRRRGDIYHVVAERGLSEEAAEYIRIHPVAPSRGTMRGRVALERRAVHIPDVLQDPEYTYSEGQKLTGYRTLLGIPLLREDMLVGMFVVSRTRVEPFTSKEIELTTTFADQAVIAIENARLFEELRDRQAELRVTFDNMGDGVVMFGADTRLVAWNRNLQEILDLPDAFLAQRPSYVEYFHYLAQRGEYSTDLEAELSRRLHETDRESRNERVRPDGRVIEVRRNPVPGGGFVLIYADITERKRAEEVIGAARDAAETALRDLRAAQDRLVQTQKLASLGQLTAGIAHEIKNPLNFVNNFSALSVELTDELNDVLKQATLADKIRAEVDELASLLKDNLGKVVQHGKRADSIVKNMLLHSREGAGERRLVDVNALVEESLNLAYHGARAEKQGFTIALERSFDPAAGEVEAFPQEITRVLLNLISNGFYAATKRQAREGGNGFEPTITAATKSLGDRVEIRIRDNGIGIPPEVREKMFNPFFTTKPTGEGTGLGLSISHDIIVKQHAGAIEVETEPGEFTELRIILPRLATSFH